MTNKEAIFIINNRLNTYYCSDDDLKALDLAIEALEEKPKDKWIPVTEKLPEDDEDVLVTRVYTGSTHSFIDMVWFNEGKFLTQDGNLELSNVVAWMPLPKPYMRGDV